MMSVATSSAALRATSGSTDNGGVGSQYDAGVAELVRDDLQLGALQQHQRRRAVPQVVKPDRREP